MTTLLTLPNFIFKQGSIGDNNWEESVQVIYYTNCISLDQGDNSVVINYDQLDKLFKEIKRHKENALKTLNKK